VKFKQGLERGKMMGKDETAKEDENTEKSSNVWVNISLLIAALIIIVLFIFLLSTHLGSPNGRDDISLFGYTKSDLGTLGDFLGGALNPILSFLTICLLVWSIDIQIRELRETREELEKSRDINSESSKTQLLSSLYSRQAIMYPVYERQLKKINSEINRFYDIYISDNFGAEVRLHSYLVNKKNYLSERKQLAAVHLEELLKVVLLIEKMQLYCADLIDVHTSLPMLAPWYDDVSANAQRILLLNDVLPGTLEEDLKKVLFNHKLMQEKLKKQYDYRKNLLVTLENSQTQTKPD
tara:strand:- start:539 stop:1423 length:885 start_codon:yes stop_codon:yes gene_type:complete